MKNIFTLFCFSFLIGPVLVQAQQWKFIKEEDGIKVYTREVMDSGLKSFRAETTLETTMSKLNEMIGNPTNTGWWDKNVKEIRILEYQKDKYNKYYLIYDIPWPLDDRDLVVEATITTDPVTKVRTVHSVPLKGVVPEKDGLVRITKYWQRWVLTPVSDNKVIVELEGFVDPAGNIPAWLYNMVITDTPIKIIHGIQERIRK